MNDRELLELAAKAAGVDGDYSPRANAIVTEDGYWMPLTDDGDALRLAVKLEIAITFPHPALVMACRGKEDKGHWHKAFVSGPDDYERATRQAITYAASEIGRGMP
ncbi:hypothetical protein [Pseudomonas sp. LG1D9]|uniref:hypothetical protein n=1 Tax=Pseudomonas sp. LG1D9 TaxID=2083054 RepID=UPI000CF323FF|nr:hypothetical protein [Pseudomonas sp. LG1D9]